MNEQYTRHQVLRAARADAERFNTMYLVKLVSHLHATYQIRLLAFKAVQNHQKLVLKVPSKCTFSEALKELLVTCGGAVVRENV